MQLPVPEEQKEEKEGTGSPLLDPSSGYKHSQQAHRVKRASRSPPPNNRKSCSLFVQTDPLLWRHVYEQEQNTQKTQEEILSMIAQHVKAVNRTGGIQSLGRASTGTPDTPSTPTGYRFSLTATATRGTTRTRPSACLTSSTCTLRRSTNPSAWPVCSHTKTSPAGPPASSGSLRPAEPVGESARNTKHTLKTTTASRERKVLPLPPAEQQCSAGRVVDELKNNCFVESDGAYRGNKIVEDGDEYDSGFDDNVSEW